MKFTKKVEKVPGEKAYTYWESDDCPASICISIAPRHLMGMENCKKYSACVNSEWNDIGWDTLEEALAAF